MKRILSLILAVLMIAALLPLEVLAEEEPAAEAVCCEEEGCSEEHDHVHEEEHPAPQQLAAEPAEAPSAQEVPAEPEPAPEAEEPAEPKPAEPEEEEPAEPAAEPEQEEPTEQPEEPAEEGPAAEAYPWEKLSDEDFIAFLYAEENAAYLTALLLNTETEEYAAFLARVEAIEDEEALAAVQTFLFTLIPEAEAEEAPAEPDGEEAPETAEEPAEELPAEQTELPEEPAEEPSEPAEPEPLKVSVPASVTLTDGAATLTATVTGEYTGELTYQWQQLDGSVDYGSELARRESWADISGATGAVLTFTNIDEETYAASCASMLYRCIVRTEDDAEISGEANLLPDTAWTKETEEEPLEESEKPEEPEEPVAETKGEEEMTDKTNPGSSEEDISELEAEPELQPLEESIEESKAMFGNNLLTTDSVLMSADDFVSYLYKAVNRTDTAYGSGGDWSCGLYTGGKIYWDCNNLGLSILSTGGSIVNNRTEGYSASTAIGNVTGWVPANCTSVIAVSTEYSNNFSDLSAILPGEWLVMDGHVGYYVGDGKVIESTTGWGVNRVVLSNIGTDGTRSLNGVASAKWSYHCKVKWISYGYGAEKDLLSNTPPYIEITTAYSSDVTCGKIRYICQNSDSSLFRSAYWPANAFGDYFSPKSECGTASISMALSYIGINKTPKEILEAHNGQTYFDGWGAPLLTPSIASGMNNYINGKGKYSPVIIFLSKASSSGMHWVLLIDQISSNQYEVLDPWDRSLTSITINGSTASYWGVSEPLTKIYQYYNANASMDLGYLSECDGPYPSAGTIKMKATTDVRSLPCSLTTTPDCENLGTAKAGSTLNVVAIWKNKVGNYWFETKFDGKQAFVWSSDVDFTPSWGDVSATNVTLPTSIPKLAYPLKDIMVTSTDLPMKSVYLEVCKQGTSVNEFPNSKITVNSKQYTVQRNDALDINASFGSLAEGNVYSFTLKAVLERYILKNGTLTSETRTETAHTRQFMVVGQAVNPPAAPSLTNFKTNYPENKDIVFTWNAVSGATGYSMMYGVCGEDGEYYYNPEYAPSVNGTSGTLMSSMVYPGHYIVSLFANNSGGMSQSANYYFSVGTPSSSAVKSVVYNGHLYERYDSHLSWTSAKAACEAKGGHLVTITSAGEQNAVESLLTGGNRNGLYCIGCSDTALSGKWSWVTGETFGYDNWDNGEPTKTSGEYYGFLMGTKNPDSAGKAIGEWLDNQNGPTTGFYCVDNTGYICEYERETVCAHSYTYSITTKPTTAATGVLTGTCSKCSDKVTVTLPKLNKTDYAYSVTGSGSSYNENYVYTYLGKTYTVSVALPTYTVTYNANGGSGAPSSQTKVKDRVLTLSSTKPTKSGSAFLGWAETSSATSPTYMPGGSYTANKAVTLYAVWAAGSCTVNTTWSDWSTNEPPTGTAAGLIESKVQYRYADLQNSTESSIAGWTQIGSTVEYGEWGNWSDWSTTSVTESNTVDVETTVLFRYHYFLCPYCNAREGFSGTSDCGKQIPSGESCWHQCWSPIAYSKSSSTVYSYNSGSKSYTTSLGDGGRWYFESDAKNATTAGFYSNTAGGVVTKTGYRSRTRIATTIYTHQSAWSSWSDTVYTASSTRKVETRTVYRYATQTVNEHSWNSGTVTTAAGCETGGIKTFTCSRCGTTKTEAIAPLGHSYTGKVTAPTCTAQGYTTHTCSRCSRSYIDTYTAATGHSYGSWSTTKAATCMQEGSKERTCSKCKNVETGSIPPLGHSYSSAVTAPTCTLNGYTTYTCSRCKDTYKTAYTSPLDHATVNHAAKAPTCTEKGWDAYETCTRCDYTTYQEKAALGHEYKDGFCIRCGESMLGAFAGTFRTKESYILLTIGQSQKLGLVLEPEEYLPLVKWSIEGGAATITDAGLVTGKEAGTAYAVASFTVAGETYSARCRVDVTAKEKPVSSHVGMVQLKTASTAVYVYKTANYATVSVLPVLEQNLKLQNSGNEDIGSGVSMTEARFANGTVNTYFRLRVKDDRTLEIIPAQEAVYAAMAGSKALRSSYSSNIIVTIDGKEYMTPTALKISVKKTKPSVKAKAVVLNSYPEVLGDTVPLSLSGAFVNSMTLTKTPPAWLIVDSENQTLALSDLIIPAKYPAGKLTFSCEVEGWAIPATLTVSYSVKKTVPSMKFGVKTVTLLQGSTDHANVKITVTPAVYSDPERFPAAVTKVEKLVGKKYAVIPNNTELYAQIDNGMLTLRAPVKAEDFKAHTYRVTITAAGKNFAYTVKTTAPVAATATVKTSGAINTLVAKSFVTLKLTPKNFHAGIGEIYYVEKIQQYRGKTLLSDNVKDLFDISNNGSSITFTEKRLGTLMSGCTYKAVIAIDTDGNGTADGRITAALKITFAKSVPTVTVSAVKSGSLDITRPGTAITLKPSVKNWYCGVDYGLVFYQKVGKKTLEIPEAETPFHVEKTDDVFILTVRDGWENATSAFSVKVRAALEDGRNVMTKSASALTVKKGTVKVKASSTSAVLYKQDRYSRAYITLTLPAGVAPIDHVTLDATSAKKLQLVDLGNNTYALEYLNNTLPISFRASTAKLSVFVEGCAASAATVSLKVSYK